MSEAIVIHTDGRPVLDIDPIELPRLTVYGNPDCTDETNADLHLLLNVPDALDLPTTELSLVWSSDRKPVMVTCGTCDNIVPAWLTFVLESVAEEEIDMLICGPCDEDGCM